MYLSWRIAGLALVALLGVLPSRAVAQAFGEYEWDDSLSARIARHRRDGNYRAAVSAAESLRARILPGAPRYEREDLEDLLHDLRLAGELRAGRQEDLRTADREGAIMDSAFGAVAYLSAAEAARRRLELTVKVLGPRHRCVARCLTDLATCLSSAGQEAAAESLDIRALRLQEATLDPGNPEIATTVNNLAVLYQTLARFPEAERMYRRALAIWEPLPGRSQLDYAAGCNNLAVLHQARGEYPQAERLYRASLAVRRELLGDEDPEVAQSLSNLAHLCSLRGDLAQAERLDREAVEIRRKTVGNHHPDLAVTLSNLAIVLRREEKLDEAESLTREALAIRVATLGEDHPDVALSRNNLAVLLATRGRDDEARALHLQALAVRRRVRGPDHPDVAESLANLAFLDRRHGKLRDAADEYRRALEIRRRRLTPTHPFVAETLLDLGLVYRDQGKLHEAEATLAEAARVYEAARLNVGTGVPRATFLESPYPALAAARLALGRGTEAWPAAERALGRVLADLLANRRRETEPSAVSRGAPAHERGAAATADPLPLARIQSSLTPDLALVGWLETEGEKGRIEAWGYVIRDHGPVRWVPLPEGPDGDTTGSPAEGVRRLRDAVIEAGASALGAPPEFRESGLAQAWWRARFRPLLSQLDGATRIVVIPSGALLGFPVEALVDDEGHYLADSFQVSYAPSASIEAWIAERARVPTQPRERGPALLVGDPPFNRIELDEMERNATAVPGDIASGFASSPTIALDRSWKRSAIAGDSIALAALPRLAWSRAEVRGVASLLDEAQVLLGPDASERRVAALASSGELARFRIIHLASHVLVDDESPERSAIVLSQVDRPVVPPTSPGDPPPPDGIVTAGEIVGTWKLNADLVTLSACQTGLGRAVAGEGYIGFVHALLQAGARSVLVSLWAVDDRATSLLMGRFYESWLGGRPGATGSGSAGGARTKASALQDAKRWLRSYVDSDGRHPYSHPYYWASFVLVGDRG